MKKIWFTYFLNYIKISSIVMPGFRMNISITENTKLMTFLLPLLRYIEWLLTKICSFILLQFVFEILQYTVFITPSLFFKPASTSIISIFFWINVRYAIRLLREHSDKFLVKSLYIFVFNYVIYFHRLLWKNQIFAKFFHLNWGCS